MGTLMKEEANYQLRGYEWDCSQKHLSQFGNIRCRFYRQYIRILKEADVITDLFRAVHHLDYNPNKRNQERKGLFKKGISS